MEFNEKLKELRQQKGLTQEELAKALYVSRTAISKWESGRGYPSIDSMKAISKFFAVSLDELLSPCEVLEIAEEDGRQKEKYFRDLVFGLIDVSFLMLLFLPLFADKSGGGIRAVSLISLGGIQPYLKIAYVAFVIAAAVLGILILALQGWHSSVWEKSEIGISLLINTVAVLLFIISLQSYAAAFAFALLIIKAFMLIKGR